MSPQIFMKERKTLGWKPALDNLYRRRHAPLIGYLILAAMTGYNFYLERSHSNGNRHELAQATTQVLVEACQKQNDLRHGLRHILDDSNATVRLQIKQHKIGKEAGQLQLHYTIKEKTRLSDVPCRRVYHVR